MPDVTTTCGIGIKLFGVPGKKLLPPNTDATTHDFILQNHDVFFVDDATEFCKFTRGSVVEHSDSYSQEHPRTARILEDMAKVVPSVLDSRYWSGLPYAFGKDRHVKYKLVPVSIGSEPVPGLSTDDPDYLRTDLRERLLHSPATFHFMVQFAIDPQHTPLDKATHRWEETVSEPVHVATLTIPRQDVRAEGQARYGEDLAFNPWHALAEHAPVGSLQDARRVVYQAAADLRREHNDVPLEEPAEPRPVAVDPESADTRVVHAKIHPAIGIARVGNSEDHWFFGPEVVRPAPMDPDSYKDPTGAMKRQAARFRIYGYNSAGVAVRELTADEAEIEWTVHVANKKAAWYEFQTALDIPEASREDAVPSMQRNRDVTGPERDEKLVIDPGPRTIAGPGKDGAAYRFDSGTFFDKKVYLGELRTDSAGRLEFLGGRGVSASSDGKPAVTFANNEKWHDDVSDGPVTAEVTLGGRAIPVDPAWVSVAPPNYAPDLLSVRTMHDLLVDAYVQSGWMAFPERVSFARHVLPVLERMSRLSWVNHGFATKFGWRGREDLLDREYLKRLASDQPESEELRRQIWNAFRNFDRDGVSPVPWPWLYGDAIADPPVSARQHVELSDTVRLLLQRWADGDFDSDLDLDAVVPGSLDEVPVSDQPAMLDEAALTFCLADAFHPGCEITWPMRHTTMYMEPFRLRHRAIGDPEPNYGPELTPAAAVGVDGPLYGQGPGSLTRWMAVPWQTDTASCLSGYSVGYGRDYDPFVPTFWPARVPNQVLTRKSYDIVMDESLPLGERQAAFERRAVWLRWLEGRYPQQINQMVKDFGKLGVVETLPGPSDGAFPSELLVESEVGFEHDVHPLRNLRRLHVPEARDPAVAEVAIQNAVDASPFPDEQVMADYFEKFDAFRRGRG